MIYIINKTVFSKELELNTDYDVIIIGGGPTGCTAAISASREGSKTLLLEATGALGGMGTQGLVPAWCPFSDKEKVIYKGLAEKIFEETKSRMPHITKDMVDWVPIDPESLKLVYDDFVSESGAKITFHTIISAVQMNGSNIDYIIASNKEGMKAYKAKIYIDCTGDADVAYYAGAEFSYGDNDGTVQPATHCFTISNVNEDPYKNLFLHLHNPNSEIYQIIDSGKFPLIKDAHICNSLIGSSTVGFNAGHLWDVNPNDMDNISNAMMTGRKLAKQISSALSEYIPETFGKSFLSNTASLMGIRETRRIVGDYELTVDDYFERKTFEDEIGRNCYYLDQHFTKEEGELNRQGKLHTEVKRAPYEKGESHGIPYRCFLPKGINNLLVAGRSISCERLVQSSIRVMPPCLVMGEAAGMAAAMASQSNTDTRGIDIQKLRSRLKEEGAYFI